MDEMNIEEEYSKKSMFEDLKNDFKNAKDAKVEVDKLISGFNESYDCVVESMKNRSKYKSMEVAKQIEKIKGSVSEPFINSSHPVRISTSKHEQRARTMQKYINNQFTSEFDRVSFMDKLTNILYREGTVWVKSAWNYKEENKREVIEHATMDEILARGEDPDVIKQMKNDKFRVEYNNVRIIKNEPDAIIWRNEHVFPDPSARSLEDLRYMTVRRRMTISELRATERYSEKVLDKLEQSNDNTEDTSLGTDRDSKATQYGYKEGVSTNDTARHHVDIIEYYGYYDINGDGIAEPIFASWAEKSGVNLILEENGQPTNAIPFYNATYSEVPYSLWGNALAYFIDDNQRAKTGIIRGIMDNMAMSNNGMRFIKKGTLDYVNFKRLQNGEKNVLVNKMDQIEQGNFNALPQAVGSTLDIVSTEANEISGNQGNGMAVPKGGGSEDFQSQLTIAQQMTIGSVMKISSLLGKVFNDWLLMAEVFLTNEQVQGLFTKQEQQDLFAFEDSSYVKVSFKVGTNIQRQIKLQQLNMLMQQAKSLGDNVPPELIRELVAEMFELFDMYDKAEQLRMYKPQPSPQEQAASQMQLQKLQLENGKLQAEIQEIQSQIQLNGSMAQKGILDSMSGAKYKDAQTTEKLSKAEAHSVDSALKPAQALAQIEEIFSKIKEGNK